MSCQVEGCTSTKMRTKTLCNAHYFRMRRHGSFEKPQTIRKKLIKQGLSYCSRCKKELPISNFHKNKWSVNGISNYCGPCANEWNKNMRSTSKTWRKKRRKRDYKNKYGISLEDYSNMLKKQNSACAICFSKEQLVVDHCHSTGVVRGLLCHRCNRSLGLLKDDPEILKNAINYLNNLST